jgi:hypothetical protein
MQIVPILHRELGFDAFCDFSDFAESVSYGTSKTCQDRGSNPLARRKLLRTILFADVPLRKAITLNSGVIACWCRASVQ